MISILCINLTHACSQKDADLELVALAFRYVVVLVPNLWLEAVTRWQT
jgi:hypothetical protein